MCEGTSTGPKPCKLLWGSPIFKHKMWSCIQAPHEECKACLGSREDKLLFSAPSRPYFSLSPTAQKPKQTDATPSITACEAKFYHPLKHYSSNRPLSIDLQLHELNPALAGRKAIAQRRWAAVWSCKITTSACALANHSILLLNQSLRAHSSLLEL